MKFLIEEYGRFMIAVIAAVIIIVLFFSLLPDIASIMGRFIKSFMG